MSSHRRPLFESSFAALALVNTSNAAEHRSRARSLGLCRGVRGGSATAMAIQFAPEPDPTANVVDLGEDQTTGPLPLDFEFEFFGVRYTWFDLSPDGFMTFGANPPPYCSGPHPRSRFIPVNDELNNFIALGWTEGYPLGPRRVAYEVRGAPQRRRLVLSFSASPAFREAGVRPMTAQLVLHERTGMIDVHTTRPNAIGSRVTQEAVRFTTSP